MFINLLKIIDYRILIIDEDLHLEILDSNGKLHEIDLEKDITKKGNLLLIFFSKSNSLK